MNRHFKKLKDISNKLHVVKIQRLSFDRGKSIPELSRNKSKLKN